MDVNPQQVAVLIDRVERLMPEMQRIGIKLDELCVSFAKFDNIPGEVVKLRQKVDEQSQTLGKHSLIIKLCGTVLCMCVGLIGWGWSEGKALYSADAAADRRLLMIEYKLNIPPPVAEGDK